MMLRCTVAALRCYMASLTEDFAFAREGGEGISPFHREGMAAKLDFDSAGFMRVCLHFYHLIEGEEGGQQLGTMIGAEDLAGMMQSVDCFVKEKVDPAITCEQVLSLYGTERISALRDQTLLLLNTLNVIAEETRIVVVPGCGNLESSCLSRKRGRVDDA